MSTLQVTNIQDTAGGNSATTAQIYGGIAKAWVNFNGNNSPGTINSSFNVSSVSKTTNGDYTINFTSALPDANYALSGSATNRNGVDWAHVVALHPADSSGTPTTKTTTQARIYTFNVYAPNAGAQDSADVSVIFYR